MDTHAASFATRWNLDLLEEQYARWQQDPASVEKDWQFFFAGMQLAMERPLDEDGAPVTSSGSDGDKPGRALQQSVDDLIYAFRDLGHSICDLDPLGMNNNPSNPQLELERFRLGDSQLKLEFATDTIPGLGTKTSLGDLIDFLRSTYCGKIGVEYMHITDPERRIWLQHQIEESRNQPALSIDDKRRVLIKLSQGALLEKFIHTKFFGQKRFSLEGAESLIPALDAAVELAPEMGTKEMVFGMAHRGRLNVLCNIMDKSYEEVFTEFEENWDPSQMEGNGDVKYHLGFSTDHITARGRRIHLTLCANPSHLEAVNPVVLGRTRAKQRQQADTADRQGVIPVIIHGDAAMAGQGLVMETFQLSDLDGYRVGGCLHIVINNQIGFTTLPHDSRSTPYCTDIAKMVEAPVWHVNGDDPEAVVHCIRMALRYRQEFGRDAVVDIVCYRRFGHNETDEPNYTQPTLYSLISKHASVTELYRQQLLDRGDLDQAEVEGIETIMKNQLQDALDQVKTKAAKSRRTKFKGVWTGLSNQYSHEPVETGVAEDTIEAVAGALSTAPANFNIHPTIKRLLGRRAKTIKNREPIEWAFAEMLAFGSLLAENIPVRLSGQDSRRGTFSQRHSYWYDVKTRERWSPLAHIQERQARYCVYNSPLSEAAVLGFDFGYSLAEPNMLIIWEAQFGDFVNGAQVIIDQFISSCEAKWGRMAGLVMMLPHGQEGAGPEHSSARLERFLESCAGSNMQVAYCSTAAQHFHILRRQMHRSFRKPLILMTPKSHLRSKEASSPIDDLVNGRFHEVLPDPAFTAGFESKAKRLILCTGKVYHDLATERTKRELDDVAIIRIEQLYPWPEQQLREVLSQYADITDITWCQEEPENFGAWRFIEPRLRQLLGHDVRYAGRASSSVPAPGSKLLFSIEQNQLLADALQLQA
ncbi:MAG: 2-oxoglutarate dehydrogenase E1 component [Planctomycetota bacterium]|jgi:2-oxoglutarate dehydrogenase E1 component|nr:2-oxoglutarate dehydrogenase E1 component [Planctomycetota bacterium]